MQTLQMSEDPLIWTSTPALFAHYCSRQKWYPAKYLVTLSEHLMDVATGDTRHLLVTMPPRHGKSTLISHYFPAWYLGNNPDKRVILGSYGAEFASSWGYKARATLQEYGYLFGLKVAQDSAAKDRWDIQDHTGGMVTTGVGGQLTGRGGDIIILDDVIKNDEEANSSTYREKAWEWYRATLYTRLEPGGSIALLMTRWHEDDLAGRLLREEPDKWTVLNLPAIAEEHDSLGRQPGEALFPKRYDVPALMDIKRTIGSYWWNALYQQRPTAEEGAMFKRQFFRYCHIENGLYDLGTKKVSIPACRVFQTCDPAVSTKASADYFVLATWTITPENDLILLDILRTRMEGPDQINLFKQAYQRWKPTFQGVEAVGVGKTLYQMLLREGLPIRELKAEADKVTRAMPAAARMEAGCVYFLKGIQGLDDFENELLSFPKGAHDDCVDVLSYAVSQILSYSPFDLSTLIRTIPKRLP